MTTVASRTLRCSPHRSASDTWKAIVELLTPGRAGDARNELVAVSGIASSIIADRVAKDGAIVATCDGPRTRIYCVYDEDAIDGANANEDSLGFDPLKGDWHVSLPCEPDDLAWVQGALKKHSTRITARDATAAAPIEKAGFDVNAQALTLDPKKFPRAMTAVSVYSYTHSVTYVADNILKSLKDIIRLSGLDPSNLVGTWDSKLAALTTWINSGHLKTVVLEVVNPNTDALITRWDIEIVYGWTSGDGSFWTDTEQLKYAIKKSGVAPSTASYRIVMDNKSGRPDVPGWSSTSFRSTDGMVRQSLGSTVEHSGLGGSAAYWRKT